MNRKSRPNQQLDERSNSRTNDVDLYGDVQDLRRRLQQTEKTLNSLNTYNDRSVSPRSDRPSIPLLKLEDLNSHGERSQSYRVQDLAHTENGLQHHTSQRSSTRHRPATYGRVQPQQQQQQPAQQNVHFTVHPNSSEYTHHEPLDLLPSSSSNLHNLSQRSGASGMDASQEQMSIGSRSDYDSTSLRKKIQNLRDENAQLVSQNHKMLNQLEDLGFDRHKSREENDMLKKELTKKQEKLDHLEEQVLCLQSENDAHEKALRDSEDRCEDYQREMGDLDGVLDEYKSQIQALEDQVNDNVNFINRIEVERDKALETAENMQRGYEDFQRKTRDKVRKFEANEEHYNDKLQYVDQEMEQMTKEKEVYETRIKELVQQIRQCQEDTHVEKQTLNSLEEHNVQLRGDLALYQHKCGQMEQNLRFHEGLKHENDSLKMSLNDYKSKLEECQIQIGESHAELLRLEQLAKRLQEKTPLQSSTPKKAPMQSTDLDGSYLETLEQTAKDAEIAELRSQLDMKEDEVTQLQAALDKVKSEMGVSGSHRMEMTLVQEKIKQGEQRIEELESLLLHLEEERGSSQQQLCKLEEQLSDLQINTGSLESKLTHRNSQVNDMQKELSEKVQETTMLEREVRKKTSQISSLERQLDHKVSEVSEQVSRVSDLEDDLQTKQLQLQQVKKSLEDKSNELLKSTSMAQKLKSVHVEQCQELEKQIELLEQKFQGRESQLKEKSMQIKSLENELAMRDGALTETLTKAQMEIERRSLQNDNTLQAFEKKAQEATNRVKQLESALVMCKEELNVYMEQYQETKAKHELEMSDKLQHVDRLQDELLKGKETLGYKDKQVVELEGNLAQRLDMVQQSNSRIAELEDTQTTMEKKICELEQHLHKERSRGDTEMFGLQTEVKGAERKLQQACAEVEQKNMEIQRLRDKNSELESIHQSQSEDLAELERQLGQEKTDGDERQSQVESMNKQIKKLNNQMKEKHELVEDSQAACKRQKELTDEKTRQLAELSAEVRQLKIELQSMSNKYAESQQEVDALNMEVLDKKKTLDEYRLTIRRREDEIRSKEQEMKSVEQALEDRNWELQQRAAQLTHIDMEVRQHKTDLDQKVIRLEGQLKTAKLECTQKDKQIADVDDRLHDCQEEVREKTLQLQQSEQACRKVKLEVENKATQLQDIEMQVYTLRHGLENSISENTELGQELKTAREEIQQIHSELTESRRELSISRREQQKWQKQCGEYQNQIKDNEAYMKTMSAELGLSKAQCAELETQTESEMRKLIKEVDAMRERHNTEIKDLTTTVTMNKQNEEQLQAQVQELQKREEQLVLQLDNGRKEALALSGQMYSAQSLLEQVQGNVSVKDSEIARLEGRIAGYERTSTLNMSASQVPYLNLTQLQPTQLQPTPQPAQTGYQVHNRQITSGTESTVSYPLVTQQGQEDQSITAPTNRSILRSNIVSSSRDPVSDRPLATHMARASQDDSSSRDPVSDRPLATHMARASQDDSIVSLLNRMQMHEQHVQDVLQDRLSTSLSKDLNKLELNDDELSSAKQLNFLTSTTTAAAAHSRASATNASSHSYGKGATGSSFTSSGRGTLLGSDGPSESDLANYLAHDPNSFQAMFKRLKDSYTSQEQSKTSNLTTEEQQFKGRGTASGYSIDDNTPQQIPTKDILGMQASGGSTNTDLHQEYGRLHSGMQTNPLLQQHSHLIPELSLISSISDSESTTMQKKKSKSAIPAGGIQQFTSSPKTARNTKKTVRISTAPPQVRPNSSRTGGKSQVSGKVSKKQGSGKSGGVYGGSKKTGTKSGLSGSSSNDSSKQSKFSDLLAKGLADIEAAARPHHHHRKTQQSPAETQPSPNISTAISHYASEDYSQSNDGSFLNDDNLFTVNHQSSDGDLPFLGGSSVEELLAKQIVLKDEVGHNKVMLPQGSSSSVQESNY